MNRFTAPGSQESSIFNTNPETADWAKQSKTLLESIFLSYFLFISVPDMIHVGADGPGCCTPSFAVAISAAASRLELVCGVRGSRVWRAVKKIPQGRVRGNGKSDEGNAWRQIANDHRQDLRLEEAASLVSYGQGSPRPASIL